MTDEQEPAGNAEPEEQDVPPERVIDPPEVNPSDVQDPERQAGTETVNITQTATLTLPSNASYALQAGQVMQLPSEDANYIIDQGYGTRADEPSGE